MEAYMSGCHHRVAGICRSETLDDGARRWRGPECRAPHRGLGEYGGLNTSAGGARGPVRSSGHYRKDTRSMGRVALMARAPRSWRWRTLGCSAISAPPGAHGIATASRQPGRARRLLPDADQQDHHRHQRNTYLKMMTQTAPSTSASSWDHRPGHPISSACTSGSQHRLRV